MTGTTIYDLVKILTLNTTEDQSTAMVAFINEAVTKITEKRKDSLFNSSGNDVTVTNLTAIGDTISIEESWQSAIVNYCLARYFEIYGKDKMQFERAQYHRKLFPDELA